VSNKIVTELTGSEAGLLRVLRQQGTEIEKLTRQVKDLASGYNVAGAEGEKSASRVEKATNAAARAKWEESRAIQKARDGWRDEEEAKKGSAEATKKIAEHNADAFGTEGLTQLRNYVAGLVSIQGGLKLVNMFLREMREERDAASKGLQGQLSPRAQLAQLAGGDPAKLKNLIEESSKSRIETGMSAESAEGMTASLENLGLLGERKFFAGFQDIMKDPAKYAEAVGTWQQAFGKAESGDVRAISNKMLVAGAMSKTEADEFASEMVSPAALATSVGASDEELAAIGGVLTKSSKSARITATQIRSLESAIMTRGFEGKGVLGGVDAFTAEVAKIRATPGLTAEEQAERQKNQAIIADPSSTLTAAEKAILAKNAPLAEAARAKEAAGGKLSAKELSAWQRDDAMQERLTRTRESAQTREEQFAEKERELSNTGKRITELFGSVEAFTAYENIMKNRDEIESAAVEIGAAGLATGPGDLSGRTQAVMMSDPALRALRGKRIAEERLAVGREERFGPTALDVDTITANMQAGALDRPAAERAAIGTGARIAKEVAPLLTDANGKSTGLLNVLEKLANAASNLAAASKPPPTLARPNDDR
jgi:hypothetical protein